MKFTCTQEHLVRGLGAVAPIAGRNTQLPILNHIRIQLRDGVMEVVATDLEVGVKATIPGKVEQEGECTTIARKIINYIQQLPKTNPVTLEQKNNRLLVTTTGFEAQFPTTATTDFPSLPNLPAGNTITLGAAGLCSTLANTLFAAARDNTRPEIHGVFIYTTNQELVVAATDSFRLAEDVVSAEKIVSDFQLLLPLGAAQELVRLFADEEVVSIALHEGHVTFTSDRIELSSRLIDGTYPDYRQIIPTTFKVSGSIDRDEFIRALKTLLVFLGRDSRRVRLLVQPQTGQIIASTGASDAGEGATTIEFDGTGDDLEVLFNIHYVLDGLQSMASDQVQLQFVGTAEPAVFKPHIKNTNYTYVVMPIQV